MEICRWNCKKLAAALLEAKVLDPNDDEITEYLEDFYTHVYYKVWGESMRAKVSLWFQSSKDNSLGSQKGSSPRMIWSSLIRYLSS